MASQLHIDPVRERGDPAGPPAEQDNGFSFGRLMWACIIRRAFESETSQPEGPDIEVATGGIPECGTH